MRIVHVSDCYAPRTGGIESQVRDLARVQAAAGDEVHVLTATAGPRGHHAPGEAPEDDDGVAVHRLGARLPFDLPVNPAAPPRMRQLFESLAPDVVHVHAGVVSPFAFDGTRVAVDAGLPVAVTWHCMLDGVVGSLRAVVRRTHWRSEPLALSAVSGAAARRVEAVFDAPVAVVPDGIDLDAWAPAARLDGAAGSAGTGGAAGPPLRLVATMRLAPRKRGPALIDVVARAARSLPPGSLTLDVVGDGPARAAMQRRAHRRGLDDVVRLRGRVPRAELPALYAGADAFLAPARLEAFGIAALEARTAGLVVVARRGTGVEEFVTSEEDGLLVADDAAMAAAVVRLATEPGLLERLRTTAVRRRPVHGWRLTAQAARAEYDRARALRAP
ncbi:glycosyltransferase family 4 protein [Actinotalea sp. Marseille-Q4924]|uniref:glycosyltransferase family 4 protein n=1 Tax=Actinotalea sp. Marseille-Q4924 TaxID=2866571 RepID=UPI001CE457A9|nr:glycosyltransferase family 4 protein [Actinotalea sp. Marseille-Q4924]